MENTRWLDRLIALTRKYQSYNPETGAFDVRRHDSAYSRLLGVRPQYIHRIYGGVIAEPWQLVRRLAVTFSPAIDAELMALLRDAAEADDDAEAEPTAA